MKRTMNRRGLLALLGRPLRRTMVPSRAEVISDGQVRPESPDLCEGGRSEAVAVVQGRRCLALTSFCTVCVEHCPVPEAIMFNQGMPSVVPDACTGCGICHQVCPAPANAILMLARRHAPRPTQLANV